METHSSVRLENLMDREAYGTTVYGVAESDTTKQLSTQGLRTRCLDYDLRTSRQLANFLPG